MRTQQFSKNVLAASVATVFTVGGGVAQAANSFADATVAVATTAGVTVAKASSVNLGAQSVQLTEITSISNDTAGAGKLVFALDNSAKFTSAQATISHDVGTSTQSLKIATIEKTTGAGDLVVGTASSADNVLVFKTGSNWIAASLISDSTAAIATTDYVRGAKATTKTGAILKSGGVLNITAAWNASVTAAGTYEVLTATLMDGSVLYVSLTAAAATPTNTDTVRVGIGSTLTAAQTNAAAATSTATSSGVSFTNGASNTALGTALVTALNNVLNTKYGETLNLAVDKGTPDGSISLIGVKSHTASTGNGAAFLVDTFAATNSPVAVTAHTAPTALGAGTNTALASAIETQIEDALVLNNTSAVAVSTNDIVTGAATTGLRTVVADTTTGATGFSTNHNYVDSNGKLVVTLNAKDSAGTDKILLDSLNLNTSASTLNTAVNFSLDSSTAATGWALVQNNAAVSSVKIASVSDVTTTIVASKTGTSVVTYSKGSSPTLDNDITITESLPASLLGDSTTNEVKITLPSGYEFLLPGTQTGTNGLSTGLTGTVSTNTLTFNNAAQSTSAAGSFKVAGPKVLIPTTATAGDVTATVEAKLTNGTTQTASLTLFKVADKGTTNSIIKASDNTATTSFTTMYAGRSTVDTAIKLQLAELIGDSLIGGGTITLTLPSGVTFGKDYTTSDTVADGTGVPNQPTAVTTVDGTTSEDGKLDMKITLNATDAGTSAGNVRVTLNDLDLADTATVGDLNVTVGGNGGATAGNVKIATIARATTSSASGTTFTDLAGATVTIPDIVIQESNAGALVGGSNVVIAASSSSLSAISTTGATVKAFNAAGTDISSTIAGLSSFATLTPATGTVAAGFTPTNASTSTTGAVKFVVSGLKGTIATGAVGDINVTVAGGTASPNISDATTLSSNVGAKAYKQTFKVGQVQDAAKPTIPTATVSGTTTSQTITGSLIPAGNDSGAQGSVFLAAILPNNGGVFFRGSANNDWAPFTSCATAKVFFTGALGTTSVPAVTNFDVTAFKGTQIYIGYGKGGALSPAGTACNNMLNNGSYNLVHTVN